MATLRQSQLPRPDLHDDAVQAWVQLVRAYHRMTRVLEQALAPHGITLAQFEVLAHLHFDGTMSQNDLAKRLLVSKGNVCGLLDRMAKARLVQRKPDRSDRRSNQLVMTRLGRAKFAQCFPQHLDLIRSHLSVLGAGDLKTIRDGLAMLAGDHVPDCR